MHEVRQQRSRLVIAFAVALALVLVWPAWIAARSGLSDLYARPAIDFLEEKRFDGYSMSGAEWRAIVNNVMRADELMPGNPQFLEALGLLHQLKLSVFADQPGIEQMDADAAEEYFQNAVEQRPTWPYYWGNLALEHYRRGDYAADQYSRALANSSRFGPWKNDSQRLVINLGSETWEFLSPRARREVVASVERGLHRQPENTVRIVRDYGAWPELCEAGNALPGMALPHLRALCSRGQPAGEDGQF